MESGLHVCYFTGAELVETQPLAARSVGPLPARHQVGAFQLAKTGDFEMAIDSVTVGILSSFAVACRPLGLVICLHYTDGMVSLTRSEQMQRVVKFAVQVEA